MGGDEIGIAEKIKRLCPKLFPRSGKKPAEGTELSAVLGPPGKGPGIDEEEKVRLLDSLTQRERDTFLLLLEGYTLKETAERLKIGYSTANTYLTAIYRKLHVNSRAGLIINYLHMEGEKNGKI